MHIKKLLPAYQHGISDYFFGAAYIIVPRLLRLNKKAIATFTASGLAVSTFNALTATSPHIQPVFSIKAHKCYDEINLLGLALLTAAPFIRKKKKTLIFHLAYFGAAYANYLLTDYQEKNVRVTIY